MMLAKAATIVRRDMLKMKQHFDGSFESKCQEDSVSASLVALVSMVLNGPSIKEQSVLTTPQHVLTIAQLLMHNSMIRCRDKKNNCNSETQPGARNTFANLPWCHDSYQDSQAGAC